MTRIEQVIFAMRAQLTAQCRLVKAAVMVLEESPACPERDAVAAEIQAEAQSIMDACRHFNNLRSLVGTLERASGNPSPQFYEGELRPDGLPIKGCHCDKPICLRHGDVAHLVAGGGDLDNENAKDTKAGEGHGEEKAVQDDQEDLHSTPIIPPPPEKST